MRVLVGVMHCIENEFDECIAAIEAQQGVSVDYFVLDNLPNKEAHDKLYQTFMCRSRSFDFLVKVDADMVIRRDDLFRRIGEKFAEKPDIDVITMDLWDFFLGHRTRGMHAFRSTVTWERRATDVFTDHHGIAPEKILRDSELSPAATHCKNPSPFQAFHYGMHRGIKVVAALTGPVDYRFQARIHARNISVIGRRFLQTADRRIGYAAIGAELGLKGVFGPEEIGYDNPRARKYFEQNIVALDIAGLKKRYRRLVLQNRVFNRIIAPYFVHRRLSVHPWGWPYRRVLDSIAPIVSRFIEAKYRK